jgi:hypothetical protein
LKKSNALHFAQMFDYKNISFTDSETNATRVYNIPMLSGSAYIGQLYDATKDQLLFDKFLWESPISVNEEDITSVQTEAYIEESLSDRYDHFGVTASLSVSLYSGLIQVNSNKTYN